MIVPPWKFDVFKASIFALRISYFRGVTISRDSSSTETLYCLNSNTENVRFFVKSCSRAATISDFSRQHNVLIYSLNFLEWVLVQVYISFLSQTYGTLQSYNSSREQCL